MQFIDLKSQYALIEAEVKAGIEGVLAHGAYVMGPEITRLEQQLAEFVGVDHAIAVGSGTDALLMALLALDIGPGDEVITPPFSFFATAEVISLIGAKPVFVDVDPKTYLINPDLIHQAITLKTKAIMPVSLYGQCADMVALRQFGLPVIEDAAQSFGATQHGQQSCGLSTIGCTSFFPSKPLGAYGDAGACFTDNAELAEKLAQIRNHGQASRYYHVRLGINGRMDSMQAAVLCAKLKIFPDEVQKRAALGARYSQQLDNIIKTPQISPGNTHVYGQYTIAIEQREQFIQALKDQQIPTAVHYPEPLHKQPIYQTPDQHFPVAEQAARQVVSLPMHPYLTEQEQDKVIAAVRASVA